MKEYQDLIKMLKVYYHNISILHRHIASDEWFSTHEKLNEYYEKNGFCQIAIIESEKYDGTNFGILRELKVS